MSIWNSGEHSTVAAGVLENWDEFLSQCIKVMPTDYKRVLAERRKAAAPGQPAVV